MADVFVFRDAFGSSEEHDICDTMSTIYFVRGIQNGFRAHAVGERIH